MLFRSAQFAAKARGAGIPVTFEAFDGMEHVAVTRDLSRPGAKQTFDALAQFIDSLLRDD